MGELRQAGAQRTRRALSGPEGPNELVQPVVRVVPAAIAARSDIVFSITRPDPTVGPRRSTVKYML